VPLDPLGQVGPTRSQAASGRDWVRTSRGLFVPADIDRDVPEQRILEQSARAPQHAVVIGWAACRLHGGNFFDGLRSPDLRRLPVPINVGPRGFLAADREVAVHFGRLPSADLVSRYGMQTVAVTRATYDAMRLAPDEREAVVVLDMMAAARLVSIRMLSDYAARWATAREPFVLPATVLANEHSRSPMETRLRLIWVLDAHLPTPLVNCDILDRQGNFLGEVDLLDPASGTVGEYDGAEHRNALRQARDVAKEDRLRNVGLEVARITGPDMTRVPLVVHRLRAAHARAAATPATDRLWVARPRPDDLHELIQRRIARQAAYDAGAAYASGLG
jgi:hypothetical protein